MQPLTPLSLAVLRAEIESRDASTKHHCFASRHEGYAVLLEEVDELWDEVKKRNPDPFAMRKEAAHVAAMAIRFMADCTPSLAEATE
jgi:hypothetical protein